jgi:phenylacetic acid degradation operon negative regulatory protein
MSVHYPVNCADGEIRHPLSDRLSSVHARSALFDLYGDHLLARGGWAPISAVVGLLGSLDITAPAVRTAVSRMVREGWLEPEERDVRGYAASARARARLEEAHVRIYRTAPSPWDGRWHVVTVEHQADRNTRARVAQSLRFLGYGSLAADTWVAPRESPELAEVLAREGVRHDGFASRFQGEASGLVSRVWDLPSLATAYRRFVEAAREAGLPDDPEQAFAARSGLVHAWRLFLFSDPGLPEEVLPEQWPGREAAALFDRQAQALMPRASAWVDAWLASSSAGAQQDSGA